MAKVSYIAADGTRHDVDAAAGGTLMTVAVSHGVPGILADCGGSCACGTCRVYLDDAWIGKLGGASDIEAATMDGFDDPNPGKRLACQIAVTDELDGLVVRLPASQF